MSKTRCASHAAKAPVPQLLPHLSRAGRPWGLLCSLWVPSNKGMEERVRRQRSKGLELFIPFCSDHTFWAAAWYYFTFPKEGKRSLSQCWALSCLWLQDAQDRKTHSPKQEHGKETWQYPSPSPRNEAPSLPPSVPPSPRSSHLALSLPGHLSSVSKPLESPGLSWSFTVWFL